MTYKDKLYFCLIVAGMFAAVILGHVSGFVH